MTIKELADTAGVSPETVRKTAKGLFPNKFQNGVRTIFNEYQSMEIMRDVTKKNMVDMNSKNIPTQSVELPTQSVEVLKMFQVMMEQNQKFMTAVLSEIKTIRQPQLQIEQPKQDYFSLIAYCSIHNIKTTTSELKKMGMDLRKMAIAANKELHKVEDERWGKVNSYPVEILNEYFSL